MMDRLVMLLCYWGGRFVGECVYDSGPKHYFNCRSNIKYDELVQLFYTFMGLDRAFWTIKLSWKMPLTLGLDVKYCLLPLLTDENVQIMLNIPMTTPGITCIEVFAEIEKIIPTTLNSDTLLVGGASFTQLPTLSSPVVKNNLEVAGDCVLKHSIGPKYSLGHGLDGGKNLPYGQHMASSSFPSAVQASKSKRRDAPPAKGSLTSSKQSPSPPDALAKHQTETDLNLSAKLYSALLMLRASLVKEAAEEAFHIFGNDILQQISKRIPKTKEELLEINGIGKWKLNKYGDRVLQTVEATLNEYYKIDKNSGSGDSSIDSAKRRRDEVKTTMPNGDSSDEDDFILGTARPKKRF